MGIIAGADEQQRKFKEGARRGRRERALLGREMRRCVYGSPSVMRIGRLLAPFRIWALIDKGAATNVGRHLGVGPNSGRMRQQLAPESDAADKDEEKSQMIIT